MAKLMVPFTDNSLVAGEIKHKYAMGKRASVDSELFDSRRTCTFDTLFPITISSGEVIWCTPRSDAEFDPFTISSLAGLI